jgi:hypothetical protein
VSDVNENRIRVTMQPEMTPVRLEDKVDVNAEIDVGVESHLRGLGVAGAVCVALGALAILVASMMFAFGYPTPWRGDINDSFHNAYVLSVIEIAAAGVILLFFGTTAFFYGRTVLGSGALDQYATHEVQVDHQEGES